MVVARLTIPFINIKIKKSTSNGKACITNQYFPVSKSQITTDVIKTIRALAGERKEARPSKNRAARSSARVWKRAGSRRVAQILKP